MNQTYFSLNFVIDSESLKGCGTSSLGKCYGAIPQDGSASTDIIEVILQYKYYSQ